MARINRPEIELIDEVESARDAVLNRDAPADQAERMIGSLTDLRSIGPHVATLLVREALVRQFRHSTRARRIRRAWRDAVLKRRQRRRTRDRERRPQTGSRRDGGTPLDVVALASGQRLVRVVPRGGRRNGRRIRKIRIVALARKLPVALWRYVTDGIIANGATLKAA
jgi:transposase